MIAFIQSANGQKNVTPGENPITKTASCVKAGIVHSYKYACVYWKLNNNGWGCVWGVIPHTAEFITMHGGEISPLKGMEYIKWPEISIESPKKDIFHSPHGAGLI